MVDMVTWMSFTYLSITSVNVPKSKLHIKLKVHTRVCPSVNVETCHIDLCNLESDVNVTWSNLERFSLQTITTMIVMIQKYSQYSELIWSCNQ